MLSIRTQDRMSLVPYNKTIYYSSREQYTEKYIELERDVKQNYNQYLSPYTNEKMERNEISRYLSERVERYFIHEIYMDGDLLGTYKTKERALEVLDEIQQHVIGKIFIHNDIKESLINERLTNGMDIIPLSISSLQDEKIVHLPTVYQMPKE